MTYVFVSGDRVQHRYASNHLAGTAVRVSDTYVRVRWDHYGLAVAALGTMADLQRPEMLEPEAQEKRNLQS